MRVGRFPSMKDGGPTWYGVIADTNAPDEDHWWVIMAGDSPVPDHVSKEEALMLVRPSNWSFFNQPGGMVANRDDDGEIVGYKANPKAENIKNLTPRYYKNIIQGKTKAWIAVYVLNEVGSLSEGKSVYKDYDSRVHLAKEPLVPVPGIPIVIGVDFGLTPAAVYCQNVRDRWLVLRELVATDMGAARFAAVLRKDMAQEFPGFSFVDWGDPAGDFRAQTDERTPFQVFRAAGLKIFPAPTNDPALRIDAVTAALTRMHDGLPCFLLDPSCVNLRRGFESGYHYRRLNVTGAERYEDRPDKNKYSHPHDALQYALCGGGESARLLRGQVKQAPVVAKTDRDPFKHRKTRLRRVSPL
jgi:hypothetical protein